MKIAKRIGFFVLVNILIITTLSVIMKVLGVAPYMEAKGINYQSLIIFSLIWGFGGAFISLLLSRKMAKWMMGVKLISENDRDPERRQLVQRVHQLARRAGLKAMPEVGIYEGADINAFATGPSQKRSLVAVSTSLLQRMNENEVEGVLAHELAHIANGDMVTMTLLQGVINAFVIFLARVAAFFASQFVDEEKRPMVQFGVMLALEIVLGMLGMLVASAFSRAREYRADQGGAKLAGKENMIAALERLKVNYGTVEENHEDQPAIASLKISGKSQGLLKLFATHPDLNDRIARLKREVI